MRETHNASPASSICSSWPEIREWLEAFPAPTTTFAYEGDLDRTAWAFRGLKDSSYELEPTIERDARSSGMSWSALEHVVSSEFKSHAHLHLTPTLIPQDDLAWRALMQHYAVSTRLLDFTSSPFVALYFAVANEGQKGGKAHECEWTRECDRQCKIGTHFVARTGVRIWAINTGLVNAQFIRVAETARERERQAKREPTTHDVRGLLDPVNAATERDVVLAEEKTLDTLLAESLSAKGHRRRALRDSGCVCAILPKAYNPRLASQQGTFLLNCADDLAFRESLLKMMGSSSDWHKMLDIPVELLSEIEDRLFQMNIHQQSLFPDMMGLAGLIRQKVRLRRR